MRNRATSLVAVIVLGLVWGGCGLILNGKRQRIQIESVPPGAQVLVGGRPVGVTPLAADFPRDDSHRVQLRLPGHVPYQLSLERRASGWFLANLVWLPYGLIGMIVDAVVGGMYSLHPEERTAAGRMRLHAGADRLTLRVHLAPEVTPTAPPVVSPPPPAPPATAPPPPPPPPRTKVLGEVGARHRCRDRATPGPSGPAPGRC
jgi:hypothetical protein